MVILYSVIGLKIIMPVKKIYICDDCGKEIKKDWMQTIEEKIYCKKCKPTEIYAGRE